MVNNRASDRVSSNALGFRQHKDRMKSKVPVIWKHSITSGNIPVEKRFKAWVAATGRVKVQLSSPVQQYGTLKIIHIGTGQLVHLQKLRADKGTFIMELTNKTLDTGFYMATFATPGGNLTTKFIRN